MFDPCLTCDKCKLHDCDYFKLKSKIVRINDIGQANVGDMILLVEKDGKERSFISRISSIPNYCTEFEEIVFNHENNYYVILDRYLKGLSWVSDIYIIPNALSERQIDKGVFNND